MLFGLRSEIEFLVLAVREEKNPSTSLGTHGISYGNQGNTKAYCYF